MRLLGSHVMVFGNKGTGKSNWVQWLLTQHEAYRNHLVYDVCKEHGVEGVTRYIPTHRKGDKARAEFGEVVDLYVTGNDRGVRPDLLVAEEVSRTAPNGGGSPEALFDLVDLTRHYDTGFLGVARRPAQVETDLVEMADDVLCFGIRGKNDKRRLNEEAPGAGDAAMDLDPFHYVHIHGDPHAEQDWTIHSPVPEMDTTGEL